MRSYVLETSDNKSPFVLFRALTLYVSPNHPPPIVSFFRIRGLVAVPARFAEEEPQLSELLVLTLVKNRTCGIAIKE